MSIAVYGGCFNPPHLGHRAAAGSAAQPVVRVRASSRITMRFMFVSPSFFAHNTSQPGQRLRRRRKNRGCLENGGRLWYAVSI